MSFWITLSSYAPTGAGIIVLFMIVLLFSFSGLWTLFWIFRGYRARPCGSSLSLQKCLLWIALCMGIILLFPPCRRTGNWKNITSGRTVSRTENNYYDRFCFGYIPTYQWVGHCFSPSTTEASLQINLGTGAGTYQHTEWRWKIDGWFFFWQSVLVLNLLLPFLRAKLPSNIDEYGRICEED